MKQSNLRSFSAAALAILFLAPAAKTFATSVEQKTESKTQAEIEQPDDLSLIDQKCVGGMRFTELTQQLPESELEITFPALDEVLDDTKPRPITTGSDIGALYWQGCQLYVDLKKLPKDAFDKPFTLDADSVIPFADSGAPLGERAAAFDKEVADAAKLDHSTNIKAEFQVKVQHEWVKELHCDARFTSKELDGKVPVFSALKERLFQGTKKAIPGVKIDWKAYSPICDCNARMAMGIDIEGDDDPGRKPDPSNSNSPKPSVSPSFCAIKKHQKRKRQEHQEVPVVVPGAAPPVKQETAAGA